MPVTVGVDVGGTFTDCVIWDDSGDLWQAKTPTNRADLVGTVVESVRTCALGADRDPAEVFASTRLFMHGTTVATNAVLEGVGSRTGLITTAGHGDAILIMRSAGRSMGLPIEELLHVSRHKKPAPIVPRELIKEVGERVDRDGNVVSSLNEAEVEKAVHDLLAAGVDSIAVCFLWSFVNPAHERRVVEMIRAIDPDVFITASHDLMPRIGEYERVAATVINTFIGKTVGGYLGELDEGLRAAGCTSPVLVMTASGGVASAAWLANRPLHSIGSGPAGGLSGAARLASWLDMPNVIVADMGGTSLDVGVISDGTATIVSEMILNQYRFSLNRLAIESIGAGGGSIVHVDETSRGVRVGPRSAGANPGPACYGRGGTDPTTTDADLVLGYLEDGTELSGGIVLDAALAERALERVSSEVGLSVEELARGTKRIVDHQMSELIRQQTVERGRDPRDFVLFSYGGAGGLHAVELARELGLPRVVVPLGNRASVWSAFGVASARLTHVFERSELVPDLNPERITAAFAKLSEQAVEALLSEGVPREEISLERSTGMKFTLQINNVDVPWPDGPISAQTVADQTERFISMYRNLFGHGSGYADAGVQISSFRVTGRSGEQTRPLPRSTDDTTGQDSEDRVRSVYWPSVSDRLPTRVYTAAGLVAGWEAEGPLLVVFPATTVAVGPKDVARLDDVGNIQIDIARD